MDKPETIEQWWPALAESTRAWLIENNGDELPPEIIAEVTAAGGAADLDGAHLSDAAVDWVETVANDESPEG
jgi:hypothetical protein